MRARLLFANAAAHARIAPSIEVTAAVEGGVGPVRLGTPAVLPDGRHVMSHVFEAVDADWILAYADDSELSIDWEAT
ncbi:MAG: hypothetical protein R2748_23240 [Bryobacterales bacterium]